MKIFGIDLFTRSKKLYDFAQHGLLSSFPEQLIIFNPEKESKKRIKTKVYITPKRIYELKSLNDNKFYIKTEQKYIQSEIKKLQDKLNLIPRRKKKRGVVEIGRLSEEYGRLEVLSMIERLKNRYKIEMAQKILEKYPHTTNKLIRDMLKAHKNLQCNHATDFIPDFPEEATNAMKKYNDICRKICGKETNFYVIASQKDFQKKNERRDPILLAQSPFGFFWQILGAWDEEIVCLDEL